MDSLPPTITIQELLLASESDPTLKVIKECLAGNWDTVPQPFQTLKEELMPETRPRSEKQPYCYSRCDAPSHPSASARGTPRHHQS